MGVLNHHDHVLLPIDPILRDPEREVDWRAIKPVQIHPRRRDSVSVDLQGSTWVHCGAEEEIREHHWGEVEWDDLDVVLADKGVLLRVKRAQ